MYNKKKKGNYVYRLLSYFEISQKRNVQNRESTIYFQFDNEHKHIENTRL